MTGIAAQPIDPSLRPQTSIQAGSEPGFGGQSASKTSAPLLALSGPVAGHGHMLGHNAQLATTAGLQAPASSSVAQRAVKFELPRQFQLNERFFALTTTLDIKSNEGKLGTVSAKWISLTPSFKLKDPDGRIIATARQKIFSWGVEVEVKDPQGRLIGTIKEQIFKSLFKWRTVYSIKDAQGNKVAESTKTEYLSTDFELRADGRTVATMSRPWFNITDKWDVTLSEDNPVDPRMLVMITAYKTMADNRRRAEQDDDSGDSGGDEGGTSRPTG